MFEVSVLWQYMIDRIRDETVFKESANSGPVRGEPKLLNSAALISFNLKRHFLISLLVENGETVDNQKDFEYPGTSRQLINNN